MEQSLELFRAEKLVYAATLTHDARATAEKYQRHLFNLLRDWCLFRRVKFYCKLRYPGTGCHQKAHFDVQSPRDWLLQSASKRALGETSWSVWLCCGCVELWPWQERNNPTWSFSLDTTFMDWFVFAAWLLHKTSALMAIHVRFQAHLPFNEQIISPFCLFCSTHRQLPSMCM